jgi:WD40 repeat protein
MRASGAVLGAVTPTRSEKKTRTRTKSPGIYLSIFAKNSNILKFFRDSVMSEEPPVDYIITGGVDDLVKVWELQDDRLVLKHNLEGHSLGVVSVAVSNSGKCEFRFGTTQLKLGLLQCVPPAL